jgi:heme oxygenase
MSLKELTAEKHKLAESSAFMKAIFDKKLPQDLWVDWTFQKTFFYDKIETLSGMLGVTSDIPEINRTTLLFQDYTENNVGNKQYSLRQPVKEYVNYLDSISNDPFKITAHLYTWHMGDLFGGQMIKRIVPGSHKSLEFISPQELVHKVRLKLKDDMYKEANIAFDWAIKMMRDYDKDLGEGN